MNIAKEDLKFYKAEPDLDFSPERNKRVIENSIKKYEKIRNAKIKVWRDKLAERTDALASYFTSPKFISTPHGRYFGKKWMAYLRGEKVMDEIFERRLKVNTNTLYKDIKSKN